MFRAVLRLVPHFVNECVLQLVADAQCEAKRGDCGLTDADPAVVRGDRRVHEHIEAAAQQAAFSTTSVSLAFWKTPPVRATVSRPCRSAIVAASSAVACPKASWNPAAMSRGLDSRSRSARRAATSGAGSSTSCVAFVGDRDAARVARCVDSGDGARQRLELDRRLGLVADALPAAEQRGDGVEQPAGAGGHRRRRVLGEIQHESGRGVVDARPARSTIGARGVLRRRRPRRRPCATARGSRQRRPACAPAGGDRPGAMS